MAKRDLVNFLKELIDDYLIYDPHYSVINVPNFSILHAILRPIIKVIIDYLTITNVLLSEVIDELNFQHFHLIYVQFIKLNVQHFKLNALHFIITLISLTVHVSLHVFVIMNHVYLLLHLSLPL